MLTRRGILAVGTGLLAAGWLPRRARGAALPEPTRTALEDSDLVYITPLKRDGTESTCHAEVWFAYDGADVFVCTSAKAWRTRAIAQGLNQARLWVGEYGTWTDSDGAFRQAPELIATGAIETEPAGVEHGLERLGDKYSVQWIVWGPRFRNGLADGSRVMLRYTPTTSGEAAAQTNV